MGPGTYNSIMSTGSLLPEYVGTGSRAVASGSGTATVTYPSGVAVGDLILLFAQTDNSTNINVPSGWTSYMNQPGSEVRHRIMYKYHDTGSTVGVSATGSHIIATVAVFRNTRTSSPLTGLVGGNQSRSPGSPFSLVCPTTTENNCLVITSLAHNITSNSSQASGGANPDLTEFQEIVDISTTTSWDGGIVTHVGFKEIAGAVGNTSFVLGDSAICCYGSFAIRPVS